MTLRLSSKIGRRRSEVYIHLYCKELKSSNSERFYGIVIHSTIRGIKEGAKYILDLDASEHELTHDNVIIERVDTETVRLLFADSAMELPQSTITAREEALIETTLKL